MKIGIIGFGNQAKSWAHNLKDNKYEVAIILRKTSPQYSYAQNDFNVFSLDDKNLRNISHFCLLTPDHTHLEVLSNICENLDLNSSIIYAHGFSVTVNKLNEKFPQFHHLLLAPKSIASELRQNFITKKPIAAVYSVEYSRQNENEKNEKFIFKLAKDLGINAGPYRATFQQEMKADLFSEQSLLCGLFPYAINQAFNTLIENGIPKELAFLECYHESLLIMKAFVESGPEAFFKMISPNAHFGAKSYQDLLAGSHLKEQYEMIFKNLNNGQFVNKLTTMEPKKLEETSHDFWSHSNLQKSFNEMKHLYERKKVND